jgi:hypothetical protein
VNAYRAEDFWLCPVANHLEFVLLRNQGVEGSAADEGIPVLEGCIYHLRRGGAAGEKEPGDWQTEGCMAGAEARHVCVL